ncbi:MAG: molybdenum cofactor guanylyltransferase [Gammaproteobacteria bacterium]|nr:molybdenum cofactor guanylyltransferase [Gammaproteobacteria bacterium]
MITKSNITTVILAGGRGRRMGGLDKGLMIFAGKPMIEHTLAAMKPQCQAIIINANRNIEHYTKYNHPVLSDDSNDFQGPLAGFAIALENATTPLIVTVPCDAPIIPDDLVERLLTALQKTDADIAVAHDGERLQPVYALIKTDLSANLNDFLSRGDRKIDLWYAQNNMVLVDFSDIQHVFKNINTPDQQKMMDTSK